MAELASYTPATPLTEAAYTAMIAKFAADWTAVAPGAGIAVS